jgi:hypothetical protein
LLWRLAKYGLIAAAKRNVRNQQTPEGTPWPGRKTKRRGKMLRNMPKLLHIREMPEIDAVRVYLQGGGYRNGETLSLPGWSDTHSKTVCLFVSAAAGKRAAVTPERWPPLRRPKTAGAGVSGSAWKTGHQARVSADNRKHGLRPGGTLIRKLSGKAVKNSWQIDLPARVFLGMSDDEFNKALARQLQAIGFGWDVNAQDIKGKP